MQIDNFLTFAAIYPPSLPLTFCKSPIHGRGVSYSISRSRLFRGVEYATPRHGIGYSARVDRRGAHRKPRKPLKALAKPSSAFCNNLLLCSERGKLLAAQADRLFLRNPMRLPTANQIPLDSPRRLLPCFLCKRRTRLKARELRKRRSEGFAAFFIQLMAKS